jgi:pyridoxine/pyridoxamine 5'-phosphate oxidase
LVRVDRDAHRRQTDFAIDANARWLEEAIELRIRNYKSQAVQVQVPEPLHRWSGRRIMANSQEYVKDSAQQLHFNVNAAADAEAVVRDRVRCDW